MQKECPDELSTFQAVREALLTFAAISLATCHIVIVCQSSKCSATSHFKHKHLSLINILCVW